MNLKQVAVKKQVGKTIFFLSFFFLSFLLSFFVYSVALYGKPPDRILY